MSAYRAGTPQDIHCSVATVIPHQGRAEADLSVVESPHFWLTLCLDSLSFHVTEEGLGITLGLNFLVPMGNYCELTEEFYESSYL